MKLRPATMADAETLFRWRNDSETRLNSHTSDEIDFESHCAWLRASLRNPSRQIFIAEIDLPVGTVRTDFEGGTYEASWTVAPEFRGMGYAKQMVSLLTCRPIRAEVKAHNTASIRIAESVGMRVDRVENGVVYLSSRSALVL